MKLRRGFMRVLVVVSALISKVICRSFYSAMIIILSNLAAHSRAEAAQTTAMEMFELCSSSPQSQSYLSCTVYMNGFASGIFVALAANHSKDVCLPDYFNGDDARAVFNRFVKSTMQEPRITNQPLSTVLWFAIANQFPCKN